MQRIDPSPSDPLVGGLPARQDTDQGVDRRSAARTECVGAWSRVGPRSSIACGTRPKKVVETRRLELLTLSLQRRRSAN